MRNNIVHQGAGELTYEIRGIVEIAEKIKSLGQEIYWEKYQGPCRQRLPNSRVDKRYRQKAIDENKTFAYNPTKGLLQTREFLAKNETLKTARKLPPTISVFQRLGRRHFQNLYLSAERNPHHRPVPRLFHPLLRRSGA